MSANLVKKEGYTVDFEITVSPEMFEEGMQKSYIKNRKNIMIHGFRKGKAPRKFIEKLYGEAIFYEDAVNELLPKVYPEAVEELKLDPVSRPEIDIKEIGTGKELVLTVKVDVTPDVKLPEYKGIKVEKTVYTVTDQEVDAEIKQMQERNARMITVEDRAAEMGDIVNIDYEGSVDGVPFDGGKADAQDLELGSGSFIPGFEEQVAGMKIGEEKDIQVKFPDEYHAEDLKGKDAVFKIKLNKIQKKEVPELDDEFAKDVSEFDTLAELKADIKKRAQERRDQQSENELENKVVEAIVSEMEVDIPPAMIEDRTKSLIQDFDMQLRQQGMSLDLYSKYTGMTVDSMQDHFKSQAESSVKGTLALSEIAKAEKVEVSEAELEEELKKLAEQYHMELDKIKEIMQPQMESFKQECITHKTVKLLVDNAKITEVKPEDKKSEENKPAAKKTTAKKTAAKKGEDDTEKKPAAKKTAAKKTTAKTADAGEKKTAAKKTTAKKTTAKKDEE